MDAPPIQVDEPLRVQLEPELVQKPVEQPHASLASEALIDGLPQPIALRQVSLLCTGNELPHRPVHPLSVIPPAVAASQTGTRS